MYKSTPEPELQYKTESERISSILIMQDLIYNLYIFRVAIPLPYISEASSFTGTNITDFFERFKDMAINYGLSDDYKV